MDPNEILSLPSAEEAAVRVMDVIEAGLTCCVIGSPSGYRLVESLVGRHEIERGVLVGQRPGEVWMQEGGLARFYVNHKRFQSFEARFARLVEWRHRPCVVVYEDDDGKWESRNFESWRQRGLVKPPPTAYYRLRHPCL